MDSAGSVLDVDSFLECPICLESILMLDTIVSIRSEPVDGYCEHSLCKNCLDQVLAVATENSPARCPTCQRRILGYDTNRMAMALKEELLKMQQRLSKINEERKDNAGGGKDNQDQMIQRLEAEVEEHRKISAELRDQLHLATENAERLHQELRNRESELQREIKEQAQKNHLLDRKAADLERQISKLESADGERASLLAAQLAAQRAEIENGRIRAESLEKELQRTKVDAEANLRKEEEARQSLETRFSKTLDKYHSMRSQLKRQELEQIVAANPAAGVAKPAGGSAELQDGSVLAASVAVLGSLFTSPIKYLKNIAQPMSPSSLSMPTSSSLSSYLFSKFGKDYKGPLVISVRSLNVIERRGATRDCRVYKATLETTPGTSLETVAIKKFQLPAYVAPPKDGQLAEAVPGDPDLDKEIRRNATFYSSFREAMLLHHIKHKHIIGLKGVIRSAGSLYNVMNYAAEDLEYISEVRPLTLPQIQHVAYQLLSALHYLHSQDIVHRGVSPNAVLLSSKVESPNSSSSCSSEVGRQYSVTLAGFSLARSLLSPHILVSSHIKGLIEESSLELLDPSQPWFDEPIPSNANMRHWAPELILKDRLHMVVPSFSWKKVDAWAVGVTLAELLRQGLPLFSSSDANGLINEMFSINDCRPSEQAMAESFPLIAPFSRVQTDLKSLLTAPRTITQRKVQPCGLYGASDVNGMKDRAISLVKGLLQVDPQARFSVSSALEHDFFKEIARARNPNLGKYEEIRTLVTDDKLADFVASQCGAV